MLKVGDLVTDERDRGIGIALRQVGIIDRWVVKWLTGQKADWDNGLRAHWSADLYPLDSSETEKKVKKKLDK